MVSFRLFILNGGRGLLPLVQRDLIQKCVRVCSATQTCQALCDWSPPGSSVHGILPAEYWSGLPLPPPGDLPDPGIEPVTLASLVLAGGFFTSVPSRKP